MFYIIAKIYYYVVIDIGYIFSILHEHYYVKNVCFFYDKDLLVRIKLKLKPDGSVISSEILDHEKMNKPGQKFYKVLAESALRAIKLCQPLRVPSTGYERWKDLQLNFDAREMLEG